MTKGNPEQMVQSNDIFDEPVSQTSLSHGKAPPGLNKRQLIRARALTGNLSW